MSKYLSLLFRVFSVKGKKRSRSCNNYMSLESIIRNRIKQQIGIIYSLECATGDISSSLSTLFIIHNMILLVSRKRSCDVACSVGGEGFSIFVIYHRGKWMLWIKPQEDVSAFMWTIKASRIFASLVRLDGASCASTARLLLFVLPDLSTLWNQQCQPSSICRNPPKLSHRSDWQRPRTGDAWDPDQSEKTYDEKVYILKEKWKKIEKRSGKCKLV